MANLASEDIETRNQELHHNKFPDPHDTTTYNLSYRWSIFVFSIDATQDVVARRNKYLRDSSFSELSILHREDAAFPNIEEKHE